MDPATLAGAVISGLSPLVARGMEELAKTAFKDAYLAIKQRLSHKPESQAVVEKFEQDPEAGAPALQAALTERLSVDAELMRLLAEALEKFNATAPGSLVNKIEADKVVVANKIDNVNM